MNYKDIQDAVLRRRFDEASRDSAKLWIQDRYAKVWQYADWPIKETTQLSLTVTSGTATIALPSSLGWTAQGIDIYDDYGNVLTYMAPADFFRKYGASPSAVQSNSTPAAWTITVDPSTSGTLVFRVGPTPASSTTFTVQGWNLPVKKTPTPLIWSVGSLSDDKDSPWWPDDFHFFIVPGAQALGLKLENDPTWQPLEDEFNRGLSALATQQGLSQRQNFEQWGGFWNPGYPGY